LLLYKGVDLDFQLTPSKAAKRIWFRESSRSIHTTSARLVAKLLLVCAEAVEFIQQHTTFNKIISFAVKVGRGRFIDGKSIASKCVLRILGQAVMSECEVLSCFG
ncbi:MAG: hypothetical protein ACI9XU_001242, partial [Arenicella sp.]